MFAGFVQAFRSLRFFGSMLALCLGTACDARVLEVVRDGPRAGADAGPRDAAQAPEITSDAALDAGLGESCDGRDNDGNGLVDDLDQAGDGLCDCLRIGVFGTAALAAERHVLDSWLRTRVSVVPVRFDTRPLDAELLAAVDVLVVEDLSQLGRLFAGPEQTAFDAWLRAGGGLFVLAGFGSSVDNVNLMLAPYAVGFDPPSPLITPGTEQLVDSWAMHPVSEGVGNVLVSDGQPTRGLGMRLASSGMTEWGRVHTVDDGRLVLWGDDRILDASTFADARSSGAARLWHNALTWLTPKGRCQLAR